MNSITNHFNQLLLRSSGRGLRSISSFFGAVDWLAGCQPRRWKLAWSRLAGANSVTHFSNFCLFVKFENSECSWRGPPARSKSSPCPKKNAGRAFSITSFLAPRSGTGCQTQRFKLARSRPLSWGFAETDAVSIRRSCQTAAGLAAPALPVKGGLKNTTKDGGACIYTNQRARCLICDFGAFVIHWPSSSFTVVSQQAGL